MAKNSDLLDHDELLAVEEDYQALKEAHSRLSKDPPEGLKGLEMLANKGSVARMMYLAHAYLMLHIA